MGIYLPYTILIIKLNTKSIQLKAASGDEQTYLNLRRRNRN